MGEYGVRRRDSVLLELPSANIDEPHLDQGEESGQMSTMILGSCASSGEALRLRLVHFAAGSVRASMLWVVQEARGVQLSPHSGMLRLALCDIGTYRRQGYQNASLVDGIQPCGQNRSSARRTSRCGSSPAARLPLFSALQRQRPKHRPWPRCHSHCTGLVISPVRLLVATGSSWQLGSLLCDYALRSSHSFLFLLLLLTNVLFHSSLPLPEAPCCVTETAPAHNQDDKKGVPWECQ